MQRVNAGVIRNEALKDGMITLRQDGWRKVLTGMTTIDEVARVTAGDLIAEEIVPIDKRGGRYDLTRREESRVPT